MIEIRVSRALPCWRKFACSLSPARYHSGWPRAAASSLRKFASFANGQTRNSYEIELRGRLTVTARKKALAYCRTDGKFLGEFKQIAIFCDTQNEQLGSFYDPKVRIALQLSYDIQSQKKTLQLKAKNGHWANVGREELILKLEPEALRQAYQLLGIFGISKGCPRFYHRVDYRFEDIILSLKDGGLAPDHWEAEVSTTKQDEKRGHQKLQKFLQKLNLTPWSETEYKDIINKVYRENPAVEFREIDIKAVWKQRS